MMVRWRMGAVGVVALEVVAGAVTFLVAVGCASFGDGRLIVPLSLTRPVPATSPPPRAARMVPVLLRVRRACGASIFGSIDSAMSKLAVRTTA